MQRGTLKKWDDDRGFGFIKPDQGSKDIFLHINALPRNIRRPKIGDIIIYELKQEKDGKFRAYKASIQGVIPVSPIPKKSYSSPSYSSPSSGLESMLNSIQSILGLVILAIAAIYFSRAFNSTEQSNNNISPNTTVKIPAPLNPTCTIKGNISVSSGKKWYHLPGMEDYETTTIHPDQGERWFCSEQEAIAAGWTKAPN